MDGSRRQSNERCREDDRADTEAELRDTRDRNHYRRSQGIHTSVHGQNGPEHRARYRFDRRVLSREREVLRADAEISREVIHLPRLPDDTQRHRGAR